MYTTDENIPSLHLRHSTPSAERGSVHSAAVWPDCLHSISQKHYVTCTEAQTNDRCNDGELRKPCQIETTGHLLAITTGEPVFSSLRTVTSTVTNLVTIHTFDCNSLWILNGFFWTSPSGMTEFCSCQCHGDTYVQSGVLPLQRGHFGIPRSIGIPAFLRRSRLSSAFSGHPAFCISRLGLSER